MTGLEIISTGAKLPIKATLNDEMRKFVDTSDEWISTRTGIKQRYFCNENENATTLAISAAKEAIENSNIDINDIGVCIVATMSAEYSTPSTACLVQKALGLPTNAIYMDLNAACSGFLYALHTAYSLLQTSKKKYALVIGAEQLSDLLDFTDRNTCVLFGDGAGAVLIQLNEENPYFALHGSKGDENVLYANNEDRHLHMDGHAVFRFATTAIEQTAIALLKEANYTKDNLKYVVCHQANSRILDLAAKKLNWQESLFYKNLHKYGNTSAASIPLALHELFTAKELPKGSKVLCLGFGAGLTWGGALLTF